MKTEEEIPGVDPLNREETKAALKREAVDFIKLIVLVLVLVVLTKTFLLESCPVHGPSMYPTLAEDERILVWKLPAVLSRVPVIGRFDPVAEGDLVVFDSNDELNKRYVKRLIAAGPRPPKNAVSAQAADPEHDVVSIEYERGRLFINNHLLDEPYLTPEERRSSIQARALLRTGEYYVLGDHRSVSKDSRRFGPIGKDQVVGKAVLRYWPLNKFGFL